MDELNKMSFFKIYSQDSQIACSEKNILFCVNQSDNPKFEQIKNRIQINETLKTNDFNLKIKLTFTCKSSSLPDILQPYKKQEFSFVTVY